MNIPFQTSSLTPVIVSIPPQARVCFYNAARRLELSTGDAQRFADTGVMHLPGLSLHMQLWGETPAPQWYVVAALSRPDEVPPSLWNELLLRSNCSISAMSTCAVGIDEHGDAVLVNRLAIHPYSDFLYVADELALVIALAESLIGGATALSTGNRADYPQHFSSAARRPTEHESIPVTLALNWHQSLIDQALRHLGSTQSLDSIETICVLRLGDQQLEVVADSDKRHLVVSTAIANVLRSDGQRALALGANLELMTLTGCTIAMAPHGACLQGRWDSRGLDGRALGNWLGDFSLLARTVGVGIPPFPATRTRP